MPDWRPRTRRNRTAGEELARAGRYGFSRTLGAIVPTIRTTIAGAALGGLAALAATAIGPQQAAGASGVRAVPNLDAADLGWIAGEPYSFGASVVNRTLRPTAQSSVALEPSVPLLGLPPSCTRVGVLLRYVCRVPPLMGQDNYDVEFEGVAPGQRSLNIVGVPLTAGSVSLTTQFLPDGAPATVTRPVAQRPQPGQSFVVANDEPSERGGFGPFRVRRPNGTVAVLPGIRDEYHHGAGVQSFPMGSSILTYGGTLAYATRARAPLRKLIVGPVTVRQRASTPDALDLVTVRRAGCRPPAFGVSGPTGAPDPQTRVRLTGRLVRVTHRGRSAMYSFTDGCERAQVDVQSGKVTVRDIRRGTSRAVRSGQTLTVPRRGRATLRRTPPPRPSRG